MSSKPDDRSKYLIPHKFNERIRLKTGTFLHVYCPYCSASLIENNEVKLNARASDDQKGQLELSPYLNVFGHRTELQLPEGVELADITCPKCNASLIRPDVLCGICNAKTTGFLVSAVQTRVPFYICTRQGCRWHGIAPEDEQQLIQEASDEW